MDCVQILFVARDLFDVPQVRRGKSHESYVVRCGKSTSQKSDVRCVHVHKSDFSSDPFARWCLRGRSFIADHSALLVVPAVAEGKIEIGSPGSSLTFTSLSSNFTASGSSVKRRERSLTKHDTLWSE